MDHPLPGARSTRDRRSADGFPLGLQSNGFGYPSATAFTAASNFQFPGLVVRSGGGHRPAGGTLSLCFPRGKTDDRAGLRLRDLHAGERAATYR